MIRKTAALLALAALSMTGGCEAIESRNGVQCETTSECTARGTEFAGTICSSGFCETISVPEANSSTACTTSESCLFTLGVPARCIGGSCVSLTPTSTVTSTPLCTTYGAVSDDSAALIGAIVPFGGSIAEAQSLGIGYETSIDHGVFFNSALSVWNQAAAAASPPAPQFGVVACDETDLAGVEQLFAILDPAFIVGPFTNADSKALLQSNPAPPLFEPLADGSYFTQSAGGSHYSCSASLTSAVAPFQNAIDQVSRYVASTRMKTTVKLSLVQDSAEPDEAEFATSITNGLAFNGEQSSSSAVFQSVDVNSGTDRIDVETPASGVGISQANQIAVFQPDVVVLTGPIWAAALLDQIERRWSGLNRSLPPPVYLIMRTSPAVAAYYQAGAVASLVNRIYALDVGRSSAEVTNYRALQLQYADLGTTEPYGAAQFNDCLYAGMYGYTAAAIAAGSSTAAVSSMQLVNGVAQVTHTSDSVSGRGDLQSDPSTILDVFSLLSNKATIELVGAGAYLGFDPTTGIPNLSAPSPGSTTDTGYAFTLQCPVQSPAAPGWQTAGVSYDKNTPGTPVGQFGCPAN